MYISILAIGQLPQFLKFKNEANNCWLNSITQMILSSGNIVEAITRTDRVDGDLTSSIIMFVCSYLNSLSEKHKRLTEEARTIVDQKFISEHIGFFIWAGVKIRLRKYNSVFEFFQAAIVPALKHYGIDFTFHLNMNMHCNSCKKSSIISTQTWDYLLILFASVDNNFVDILCEMYGPTPQNSRCSMCLFNGLQEVSLSIAKFPKHLFVRFHATTTTGNKQHKLSPHIDLWPITSDHVVFTRSYCRYTLQSFTVFTGEDDAGHYYTIANRNNEWYKLDDDKISIIPADTIFGSREDRPPAMFALYTRPSNKDVFSTALWNIFTNFTQCTVTLPPLLSLNDAVDYFAKYNVLNKNLLNFAVLKQFQCSHCNKGECCICIGDIFLRTTMYV